MLRELNKPKVCFPQIDNMTIFSVICRIFIATGSNQVSNIIQNINYSTTKAHLVGSMAGKAKYVNFLVLR